MPNETDRRWLVNTIFATLIMGIASFLPWVHFSGYPGTGFHSSTRIILDAPNWIPFAAAFLVTVYAIFQVFGFAEKRSYFPMLLSIYGFLQCLGMVFVTLTSTPDAIGSASIGIGLVIATFCMFALLLMSLAYFATAPKVEVVENRFTPDLDPPRPRTAE